MIQLTKKIFLSRALSDDNCTKLDIVCRNISTVICLSSNCQNLFSNHSQNLFLIETPTQFYDLNSNVEKCFEFGILLYFF